MKILVSFMSKQTVIQASVIKEASPDQILFITTPKAAEEEWELNIPIITRIKKNHSIPFRNVFIDPDISLSILVETVKKHIHSFLLIEKIKEIVLDASSGKGIHRIAISNYLRQLCFKRNINFSMIYFDTDIRKIVDLKIFDRSFHQSTRPISVSWKLEDRLSIFGAIVREYTTIYNSKVRYFKESEEKFKNLYDTLLSSIDLRTFFISYDNIKSVILGKHDLKELIIEKHIVREIKEFTLKVFGIIPHERSELLNIKHQVSEFLKENFRAAFSSEFFSSLPYSENYKSQLSDDYRRLSSTVNDEVLTLLESVTNSDEDVKQLRSNLTVHIDTMLKNISDEARFLMKIKNIDFPESIFNEYKQKYIHDIEDNKTLNNRALISIVFEKIVSYSVSSAIKNNKLLRDSISSVYQNVKLDGNSGTLIEVDSLILFKNGYVHIFEAKTSTIYNKDINSKLLVLKKYLGENVKMDIVFPFSARDIELLTEKDAEFVKTIYRAGLKHINSWLNFFHTTDKSIVSIDSIEQRLIDIALKYS